MDCMHNFSPFCLGLTQVFSHSFVPDPAGSIALLGTQKFTNISDNIH